MLAARSAAEGSLASGMLPPSARRSLCLVKCVSDEAEFLIAWHVLGCNVAKKCTPDCNIRDTKCHSVLILGIEILSKVS